MSDKKLIIPEEFMNPDAYASQEDFEKETLTYFIKDSRDLEHIVFDGCHMMKAKDIENLADLSNLTHIEFNYCADLENIDVLAKLPNLTHLRLVNIMCEDFNVLEKLPNLTHLDMCANNMGNLQNVDFLSSLTTLTHLDLSDCYELEDISPLLNLTNLAHLNLNSSSITNIDILGELPNLAMVDISGCPPLDNMDALSKVDNFNGKASFEYLSGSLYEGDWVDCRQKGFGKFKTPMFSYEGGFQNGSREGKGTEIKADGSKYEGDFSGYSYHGKGVRTYADGNTYEGDFVEGNLHGKGIFTWIDDGSTYEGDWVEGNFHGKGVYTYADGNTYEGDWVEDDRSGKGVYTYADGNTYEGDFVEGNFHGKGVFTYTSGGIYEGNFVEDKKKGNGVFTWVDGSKFEGEFTGGHPDNEKANIDTGVFTWSDGEKFEGYCWSAMNDMNEFTLAHKPTMSADKLLEIAKSTSADDKLLKSILTRTDLDDNCREIVDLKLKLQDKSSENWIETSELSSKEWGRDTFECLCNDKDHLIRAATANNPFVPQELLIDMMKMEHVTFDEKLSILSNPSCSEELLKTFSEDTQNYSSSRLRKAVALHPSTPKEIVNKLLEDEYVWVREAATSTSNLKKDEIKKILEQMDKKYPAIPRTYTIKSSSGYGIIENLGGSISMDDVVEGILSGEEYWSAYAHEWYNWNDMWHENGPTTLIDTVVYPDGTEEEINVKEGTFNHDQLVGAEIGGDSPTHEPFFHIVSSHEKGNWIYDKFELSGEFKSECLTAIYNDECSVQMVSYYEYHNEECDDDTDIEIEGKFDESRGSGVDNVFYVNTAKNGVQVCDDFYDMRDEMSDEDLDPENEDDIREYLENKYFSSTPKRSIREGDREFWWDAIDDYVKDKIEKNQASIDDYLGTLQILFIDESDFDEKNSDGMQFHNMIPFEDADELEPWIGKEEVKKWKTDWKDLSKEKQKNTHETALYLSTDHGHEYLTSLIINKQLFMEGLTTYCHKCDENVAFCDSTPIDDDDWTRVCKNCKK
jgi:hypothetical protein